MNIYGRNTGVNKILYNKLIKENLKLFLFNRNYGDPKVELTWGEAVWIGLHNKTAPDDVQVGSNISIVYDNGIEKEFEVFKSYENWILISSTSSLNEKFYELYDKNIGDLKFIKQGANIYYIRKNSITSKSYNVMDLEMRSVDDIGIFDKFKNLKMIINSEGSGICYNLKKDVFYDIKNLNIENIIFDLCATTPSGDYNPVIRGLTLEYINNENEFLSFSFPTNYGKGYIKITTKTLFDDIDYQIFPETNYIDGLYSVVSNDSKIPMLFESFAEDYNISETYEPAMDSVQEMVIAGAKYCKRVQYNEKIYYDNLEPYIPLESIDYSSEVSIGLDLNIKLFNDYLVVYSSDYDVAKKYQLDRLLITAEISNNSKDLVFRGIGIKYDNVFKEVIYLNYINKQTILMNDVKNFIGIL